MIDRESNIEESVTKYVRDGLARRGYDGHYRIIDAFPHTQAKLETNLIAVGFNYDDGGQQAECGSTLRNRTYTLEFFVFAKTATFGRNLASVIKFQADADGIIPLLDFGQSPPVEVDSLVVLAAHSQREPIQEPEPWQQFTWRAEVKVEDTYYAADAA